MFKNLKCTIIFFVSAQKLNKNFELLKEFFFFGREVIICRELTKLHENSLWGKITEVNNFKFNLRGSLLSLFHMNWKINRKILTNQTKKKSKN